jgi:hypothetical protein
MAKPNLSKHGLRRVLVQRALGAWDDQLAYAARYTDLILAVCEDLNSQFSMRVWYSVLYDNDKLLELSVDPGDFNDHWAYMECNFLLCLVKKYPHWDVSKDPELEAKKKFIECEAICRNTNQSFRHRRHLDDNDVASIFHGASKKVSKVLGRVPTPSELDLAFGPGAAYSVKRRTSVYDKLTSSLDITSKSKNQATELLRSSPGWLGLHLINQSDARIPEFFTVIPGDRLSFVPKTASTDRPIAIGPLVNVALQKGYGSWIRKRLKGSGVFLNRNPEKHKTLAKVASITGHLATVDLASASDTIAYAFVMDLLPIDWFEALDQVRSERYEIEGTWYEYEKFSAMGNGFTFELESLLFYSLAFATCEYLGLDTSEVSVFGDDIILPVEAYDMFFKVLSKAGFMINDSKSFSSGRFRESCGGDFFDGYDVRGFYIKETLTLRKIVEFHNYLHRSGLIYQLVKTSRLARKLLKPISFLVGPDDGVDDHIICESAPSGGRFLCVNTTVKPRRLPRRWLARKAVLLYDISRSEVDSDEIAFSKEKLYPSDVKLFTLSSRYEALPAEISQRKTPIRR